MGGEFEASKGGGREEDSHRNGGLSRYKIGHVGASFTNYHPTTLWESKRAMEIDYQKWRLTAGVIIERF